MAAGAGLGPKKGEGTGMARGIWPLACPKGQSPGSVWADQGKNLEQAEKMIRIAVEAQPDNPAYLDSLGWVLFKQGKNEEALVPLKKANENPEYQDATLLEHQADVHKALNQIDEAKTLWNRAVEVETKAKKPDDAVLKRLKEKLGAPAEEKAVDEKK